MSKVIGIIAVKGGVGKTTVSSSLAADLVNHFGKKVLLIDANYSAPNLGLHMDILEPERTIHDVLAGKMRMKNAIHKKYGVDVVPGSYVYDKRLNVFKLKDKISMIRDHYDFIIIDSSPSLNEEVLSAMLASDSLFVVSTPDYPTLSCSFKAAKLAKQRGTPISGIILNKIRDPKYELKLEEIEEALNIPVVAKIPDDKSNVGALYMRIPTSVYNKRTKFSREINRLSSALTYTKEKRSLVSFLIPKNFRKEEVNRQMLKEDFYRSKFSVKNDK